MGLAHNILLKTVMGDKDVVLDEITFDSTYPAGGEPIAPADIGFYRIDAILVGGAAADAGTVSNQTKWDRTNAKLQLFESGGAAADFSEQNTVDQSAKKCLALIFGQKAV
jgi:hypothetical protein